MSLELPPKKGELINQPSEAEVNTLLATQAADVIRLGAAAAAGVREIGRDRLPLWTGLALLSHFVQGQPVLNSLWEHGWGAVGGIVRGVQCLTYTLPRGINPITEISKYSAKFYCDSWPFDTWYQAIASNIFTPVRDGIQMAEPLTNILQGNPNYISASFFNHTVPGALAVAGAAITIHTIRGWIGVGRTINQAMQMNHARTEN